MAFTTQASRLRQLGQFGWSSQVHTSDFQTSASETGAVHGGPVVAYPRAIVCACKMPFVIYKLSPLGSMRHHVGDRIKQCYKFQLGKI
jgi:hypothetical protein